MNNSSELSHVPEDRKELPLAVPVYVKCDGFRSLAYRDKDGTWRYFYNRQPICGNVERIPYQEH
jgi:hypothetical protein